MADSKNAKFFICETNDINEEEKCYDTVWSNVEKRPFYTDDQSPKYSDNRNNGPSENNHKNVRQSPEQKEWYFNTESYGEIKD